jgi:hypothetical protein
LPRRDARTRAEVEIIVIPDIRALPADAFAPRAPANLLADIQTYLAERAPPTPASASATPLRRRRCASAVRFAPGQDERRAARLSDDLNRFLSPWAYDEGAELIIGGKIYANSILDFVDRRDYVDYVAEIKLAAQRRRRRLRPPRRRRRGLPRRRRPARPGAGRRPRAPHRPSSPSKDLQQSLSTGINFAKVELDFIVG